MALGQPTSTKAVFFDFMGTCLDWHSSVIQFFPSSIPAARASQFALEWRRQYFVENDRRFRQGFEPEDIDKTLARVLEAVIDQFGDLKPLFTTDDRWRMVEAWHHQLAWPDVPQALHSIRNNLNLEVFVHANGTTRLQLDLARSSGLQFNMLFSSQLLGLYKPSPDAYKKALELVKLRPEEVVMVAAHAYDLRGAQKCGMRTIYIHRWTDDIDEDMGKIKGEFDVFLEDMSDICAAIASL